ncbi:MAG TPA: HAD-IA family hydrolase [Candidatus Scubalenecus merdavium]|uniref:HAD-IA family hydrolase n=1 Tax=Candidatus Scybalenecus merdavium TaxID=2840939 RepID=A0A9D1MTN7_9FIRM|nr:HAD-IA family hydrolase [Candidatus Scubalenecus merdavium]
MVKCAIFDLDGTLINTIEDLGDAGNYTLKHYGIDDAWSYDDYKYMVGNGNRKLVERVFRGRIPAEQLEEAYRVFMEYYDRNKLNKTRPYDGIQDAIDTIKEKGIKVAVCTNKVQASAIGILDHFFGENYFDAIIGQVDGVPTKPDPAMPRRALDALGCTAQEAVYFGDTSVDMQTAKNAGIEAVGVTWGFRKFDELFKEEPSVIIDDPSYIPKLF